MLRKFLSNTSLGNKHFFSRARLFNLVASAFEILIINLILFWWRSYGSNGVAFQGWTLRAINAAANGTKTSSRDCEHRKHAKTAFSVTEHPKSARLLDLLILIHLLGESIIPNLGPCIYRSSITKIFPTQQSVCWHSAVFS